MNKSLLKEFKKDNERVVYLEDGNEFQIQIFNDQTTEIGAKIYVNGEMIGNSYLVIRPGERVWLDRYLDKARKFKFATYEVNGNNEQVQKAIQKNGLVKVELFKKKQTYDWNQPILKTWTPEYAPNIYYSVSSEPYSSCSSATTVDVNSIPTVNYCSTLDLGSSASTTTASSGTITTTASSNATTKSRSFSAPLRKLSKSTKSDKTETGRIQEGGYSNQEFDYVNMSFEYWAFDTEEIHILPKSVKPIYAEELQKTYCYNCGRKLKSKFKFCPFCGAKL